jgi:hypothetical protein
VLKALGIALSLLSAVPLGAKIYYVNKGVRYHVGDDRFNTSTDSDFIDTYPVVGQKWVQAFKVDAPDTVRVHIDKLWGVDDCSYCKDMVSIDKHDMGRLSNANNHESFNTLTVLAYPVVPGKTYYLKIESYGHPQADDFVFEGVRVETEKADVTFIGNPVIGDQKETPPAVGPCEGVREVASWIPPDAKSRDSLDLNAVAAPIEQDAAVSLAPGDFVQFYARVDESGATDRVSQAFEILLGDPSSGWVFSFPPAGTSAVHGNMTMGGHYMSTKFSTGTWKTGAWNQFRLARCTDGRARLWLNGEELSQSLDKLPQESQLLKFHALGISARLAEQPF